MSKKRFSFRFLLKPLVVIIALIAGSYLVLWIESVRPSDFGFYEGIFTREAIIENREQYPFRETGQSLTTEELELAEIAWTYFENNYRPETGFVNSVDKYNATTLWDLTSSLMATLSAYEIGIIDSALMDKRLVKAFQSLKSMQLYQDKLPNKVYNTINLEMTSYDNRPTPAGVGWSSMDIGRFLTFCARIIHNYPGYTSHVNSILSKWEIEHSIRNASLIGIGFSFKDGVEKEVQEGKLGYEEYCAKGYQLMGYDVYNAMRYTDFIKFIDVYGHKIAVDSREVKYHPGYNYVLSDPYIFDGLEQGFDVNSLELGYRVFLVQKERHKRTEQLTAVGETHIDTLPYFIYNSVYVDGETWHCVSESGDDVNHLKTFSTAAAFGWHYLFDDPYSDLLLDKAKKLYNPDLGWYAGEYEKTGEINKAITANTNATVLEALNYKMEGPLVRSTVW